SVIKQLLDDLLEDRVLNDEETDSVKEENITKTDQARCLIDMVRKKGGKATPSSPQLSQQVERQVSSVLIPSTRDFKEGILQRKGSRLVNWDQFPHKQVEFDDKTLLREGAEKDEENIERLLRDLGYDVVKHENLSGQELDEAVKAFSKREEHFLSDSVFVVMISHRILGVIIGVHYKEGDPKPDVFPINNIFTHLNTENCKALINKPK
ncbi:unnamed protein product, partial [Coregonus sp. 'balchen']